ncbi:MAG: carbohydrate-binding domain-containing protein [Candidatus Saccharibacteria bacterium]|nr:carbohydrate-binding domain-containing protein [Candidatus Saccharibacteria bacterium]
MKNKKLLAIIGGVILGAGVIGVGAKMIMDKSKPNSAEIETGVSVQVSSNKVETITLVDGENKISAGGTYTITGTTENGYVYTETEDEVKIILENAEIKNPSGAAIQIMGNGNTEIVVNGENSVEGNLVNASETEAVSAAIYAKADLLISGDGNLVISSNYHGIKTCDDFELRSGSLTITANEDAINNNDSIEISGGKIVAKAGDDGLHTDGKLVITGGEVEISEATEGLEGNIINLEGGKVSIVAKDDGVNAVNSDETLDEFAAGDGELNILGGEIYVNAGGDGLDSNGSITISGGKVYVDGPTNNGNGAMDYNGEFKITGGEIIAVGSAGMATNATSAEQVSMLINLSGNYSGKLQVVDAKGDVVVEFSPTKTYQSVLVSSPSLKIGETYRVLADGKEAGNISVEQNITGGGSGMGPGQGGAAPDGARQGGNAMNRGGRMMR